MLTADMAHRAIVINKPVVINRHNRRKTSEKTLKMLKIRVL